MTSNQKIYVAGHNGMVGSAIIRQLKAMGHSNIITADRHELDLTRQNDVETFFKHHQINQVYLAAAKVGGIHANNTYPAQFIYENLLIEANIIHSAYITGVERLLFLGSSCIYPRLANQPMLESELLTGVLEHTNEPYAIAKIAGIKLCESYNRQYGCDYRSIMPTNLYGSNDNFHLENSHVIPAMMRRFHQAVVERQEEVVIWGSGEPKREFLHVDDMAQASIYIMNIPLEKYQTVTTPMLSHINVGTGIDCTIRELAETMAMVTNYKGDLRFDKTKSDGTPRKLLDVSALAHLGWRSSIDLKKGLEDTYQWFLDNQLDYRMGN